MSGTVSLIELVRGMELSTGAQGRNTPEKVSCLRTSRIHSWAGQHLPGHFINCLGATPSCSFLGRALGKRLVEHEILDVATTQLFFLKWTNKKRTEILDYCGKFQKKLL